MKEMELYDIETDGSGRLDWAAVELTLTADLVEIEGKGRPGVFPSGHREGLTRATFQPYLAGFAWLSPCASVPVLPAVVY